ncbi:MAG: TylF/MycF/NovP-related O-methyltransferase [Burkholderiales bacterium]
MQIKLDKNPLSLTTEHYIPELVRKLLLRIEAESFTNIALYGFSEPMKWLYRLLRERGGKSKLYDWRNDLVGYDCGGGIVEHVSKIKDAKDTLLVVCVDNHDAIKAGIRYLIDNHYDSLPAIYELTEPHDPFTLEHPFRGIRERARARAISMISDEKLFNLAQYIGLTAHIEGTVVEFGSFQGGSSAVIIEAVNHFGKKPVMIFDSYEGIPKSRYGLDHRWQMTFSNNSYAQVKNAFKDCDNVQVIKGNVIDTMKMVKAPVTFCHIAIDTLEACEAALNAIWPMLAPEGIIVVDDYGSYPNCIPLTVMTDKFCEGKLEAFKFLTQWTGVFIMKRKP